MSLQSVESVTEPMRVLGLHRLSISIILATGTAWGSAVVEVQWSNARGVNDDGSSIEQWHSFAPALELSSSQTSLANESLKNASHIRLKTTTSDAGADAEAIVTVQVR